MFSHRGSGGSGGSGGLQASGGDLVPVVDWKAGQVGGRELLKDKVDPWQRDSGPLSPTSAPSSGFLTQHSVVLPVCFVQLRLFSPVTPV